MSESYCETIYIYSCILLLFSLHQKYAWLVHAVVVALRRDVDVQAYEVGRRQRF